MCTRPKWQWCSARWFNWRTTLLNYSLKARVEKCPVIQKTQEVASSTLYSTVISSVDRNRQTFYRENKAEEPLNVQENSTLSSSSRAGREYLKTALLKHPLWEDMSFWDEACWCAISALEHWHMTHRWALKSQTFFIFAEDARTFCQLSALPYFVSFHLFAPITVKQLESKRLVFFLFRFRQSISASLKEGDQSGDATTAWHDYGPAESRDAVLRVHNIVFSQVYVLPFYRAWGLKHSSIHKRWFAKGPKKGGAFTLSCVYLGVSRLTAVYVGVIHVCS